MTEREALKLALKCAERCESIDGMYSWADTITAIKEALAQPSVSVEQEPVAHSVVEPLRPDEYQRRVSVKWVGQPVAGPLYTTPPQRKETP